MRSQLEAWGLEPRTWSSQPEAWSLELHTWAREFKTSTVLLELGSSDQT